MKTKAKKSRASKLLSGICNYLFGSELWKRVSFCVWQMYIRRRTNGLCSLLCVSTSNRMAIKTGCKTCFFLSTKSFHLSAGFIGLLKILGLREERQFSLSQLYLLSPTAIYYYVCLTCEFITHFLIPDVCSLFVLANPCIWIYDHLPAILFAHFFFSAIWLRAHMTFGRTEIYLWFCITYFA